MAGIGHVFDRQVLNPPVHAIGQFLAQGAVCFRPDNQGWCGNVWHWPRPTKAVAESGAPEAAAALSEIAQAMRPVFDVPREQFQGRFYNAAVHTAAFALPTWWRERLMPE